MPAKKRRRIAAAEKNHDTKDFVAGVRELGLTPSVAQATSNRRSAINEGTTRHGVSRWIRRRVEPSGWTKTVGSGRKLRYVGSQCDQAWFEMEAAVYNLIRICSVGAATA